MSRLRRSPEGPAHRPNSCSRPFRSPPHNALEHDPIELNRSLLVTPAEAGARAVVSLDARFRGHDDKLFSRLDFTGFESSLSPPGPPVLVIAADFLRRIDDGVEVARVIDRARQRHVIGDAG